MPESSHVAQSVIQMAAVMGTHHLASLSCLEAEIVHLKHASKPFVCLSCRRIGLAQNDLRPCCWAMQRVTRPCRACAAAKHMCLCGREASFPIMPITAGVEQTLHHTPCSPFDIT